MIRSFLLIKFVHVIMLSDMEGYIMGQTLVEKIISNHAHKEVKAGELVIADVDVCAVQDGTGPLTVDEFKKLGKEKLNNPQRTILFIDHASPSPRKELSNMHLKLRDFAKECKNVIFFDDDKDCYIKDEKIWYKGEEIISLSDCPLVGHHNYQNIMCGIIAAKLCKIDNEIIQKIKILFCIIFGLH